MAEGPPTSAKLLLILIGSALLIILLAIVLFTVDRPEGSEGAGAVAPAPEQQVESEDTDLPASPRRPPSEQEPEVPMDRE